MPTQWDLDLQNLAKFVLFDKSLGSCFSSSEYVLRGDKGNQGSFRVHF